MRLAAGPRVSLLGNQIGARMGHGESGAARPDTAVPG